MLTRAKCWRRQPRIRNYKQYSTSTERETVVAKRKYALWIGYVGTNYSGLQQNTTSVPSIEDKLQAAIERAGLVDPRNMGDLKKIGWSRSSRTDKGVHSVGTIIGVNLEHKVSRIKLQNGYKYVDEDASARLIPPLINEHLPNDIKVFGAYPMPRSWRAKTHTVSRIYEYLIPTKHLHNIRSGNNTMDANEQFGRLLGRYFGTHCWHNYTDSQNIDRRFRSTASKQVELLDDNEPNDDSEDPPLNTPPPPPQKTAPPLVRPRIKSYQPAYRIVYAIHLDKINIKDEEYSRITIHGSSFLQHQIRMMVGGALMTLSGGIDERVFNLSIDSICSIPMYMVPGFALMLKRPMLHNIILDAYYDDAYQADEFRHHTVYNHIDTLWKEFDWLAWTEKLATFCSKIPPYESYMNALASTRS